MLLQRLRWGLNSFTYACVDSSQTVLDRAHDIGLKSMGLWRDWNPKKKIEWCNSICLPLFERIFTFSTLLFYSSWSLAEWYRLIRIVCYAYYNYNVNKQIVYWFTLWFFLLITLLALITDLYLWTMLWFCFSFQFSCYFLLFLSEWWQLTVACSIWCSFCATYTMTCGAGLASEDLSQGWTRVPASWQSRGQRGPGVLRSGEAHHPCLGACVKM